MSTIEQKIEIERQRFIEYYANNPNVEYYFSKKNNSPCDVYLKSADTVYICEIKVREKDIEFFKKYKPFLEHKKIAGMTRVQNKYIKEKDYKPKMLYFNFTVDGCMIFELDSLYDYTYNYVLLPKSNIDKTLIHKLVAKLNHQPIEVKKFVNEKISFVDNF
jgi:hypothetical protein